MAEENEQGQRSIPVKLALKLLPVIAAFAIGIGGAAYTVRAKPEILGLSKGPAQIQAETDAMVAEVGKLIELPADEKPTVTTITDLELERVKDQPFFKNAKNGDKVLVYTNARKAILYRPSEKRILEVGAVNINQQNRVTGAEDATFVVYNGAGTAGLASQVETEIETIVTGSEVVRKSNAARADYEETVLVDLKGDKGDLANRIAQALNIKVESLPEGEAAPSDADFLIIAGKDKIQSATAPTPSPTPEASPTPEG